MKAPWPSALLLLVAAAATDDAPLEHAVRSAMRREPGWDAALSLALLRDDCDANALVDRARTNGPNQCSIIVSHCASFHGQTALGCACGVGTGGR